MKIIVACDEWCYKYNNNYYLREFGHVLANRYLMAFEKIRFVVRTKDINSIQSLGIYNIKVIDPRIEIFEVPFFQGPKQYAKVYFDVKKRIRNVRENCDLAILRLPSVTAFSVWNRIKGELPYAIEMVADCYDTYLESKGLERILWYIMHVKTVEACNKAIGMSYVTKYYLQKHYFSRLNNSLSSYYSSIEMLDNFRYKNRKYPQKDVFTVVHVANQVFLDSSKGHRLAIHLLKSLKEKGININLIFVGSNYFNGIDEISNYAKSQGVIDCISFTGFINSMELRNVLLKSDILILPTESEGLPRVLIEGMSLGLPCISTPVSGIPELLDEEYLVGFKDVEGYTNKIIKLITDKTEYEKQSMVNFDRSQYYSKDVLDNRRKEFFVKLKNIIK